MGPVMIAAGGVAALGFAALALTGIPAITGFGLACAYGIGSAVVLEMTFVPALRSLLPAPKATPPQGRRHAARSSTVLERAILDRGGRPVLIATGVALVLAARRRGADPHLRLDARVPGARQPAARCTSRRSRSTSPARSR